MSDTDTIKVVFTNDNGAYRTILKNGEYQILENGQIKLPENYYSAGYYERITDSNWVDLPEFINNF